MVVRNSSIITLFTGNGRQYLKSILANSTTFTFAVPLACPTCGQYLTMVEKVFTLQKEKAVLEQQVASLEATGATLCNTANDATSTDTNESNGRRMNDCVDDTHPSGEIRTFQHDTFSILADGRICYCNVSSVQSSAVGVYACI